MLSINTDSVIAPLYSAFNTMVSMISFDSVRNMDVMQNGSLDLSSNNAICSH